MTLFLTSIADIWCFLDLPAGFPFKAGADTVAFMAGTAEGIADDQLATCVCFFTVIPVDAVLWSSIFVTLVAKKYRFMQFELDMVFDTH